MDLQKAKYLDPKNDLTFRKIFGEHPNIMKSFLNALLPFEEGRFIKELTYQDPGLIPELPELKHSIVDVRCTDNYDRQFIVEMQMYWTNSFKSRMLFNAGKAYIKQIEKGKQYNKLQPVYGLSLVDDIFLTDKEYEDKYYHHYCLSHQEYPNETIEGIELIFIELEKFTAKTYTDKKMRALWLRFLTEIDENTRNIPTDLIKIEEIKQALEHLQVSAFTNEELTYYDKYWDRIRIEKAAIDDAKRETEKTKKLLKKERKERIRERKERIRERKEKIQERKEKEKAIQKEKETKLKFAKFMKNEGKSIEEIKKETGLSDNEIKDL